VLQGRSVAMPISPKYLNATGKKTLHIKSYLEVEKYFGICLQGIKRSWEYISVVECLLIMLTGLNFSPELKETDRSVWGGDD
jgi:hypothetical protein